MYTNLSEMTVPGSFFLHDELITLLKEDLIFQKKENEYDHFLFKEITFNRLKKIIDKKFINTFEINGNQELFFKISNTLHAYDISLAVKLGVNFGLFGFNLLRLGEYDQVKDYIKKLDKGEIFGCLALTEIGHGSNLKKLETTATWNKDLDGFILNTPTELATKCWIGNAANHGTHGIIFAQLYYGEKCLGLHPFIVELRKDGHILPFIFIKDNGYKKGLNGVDNGTIKFDNLFLPRKNLLSKFGYIDDKGFYITSYNDANKRFGDLLATLSAGRAILASGSTIVSLKSLFISCKYAQIRRQFCEKDSDLYEKQIINYTTHQLNLMPLLAKTIMLINAIDFMKKDTGKEFQKDKISKKLHALTSGLKVICGEHAEKCCRIGRISCGGHGYSYENEISKMHNDIDIYQTFEGDNTLLRQEVGKYKLSRLNEYIGKGTFNQYLYYFKMSLLMHLNQLNIFEDTNLYNSKYLLNLLKLKEIYMTLKLVDKLLINVKSGMNNSEAWNSSLDIVLDVADSYIYRKIYEINCSSLLGKDLLMLFGLEILYNDLKWFLINNIITKNKGIEIIELRKALCKKMTKNIDQIFDKFNLPEIFWNVPIISKLKANL